MEQRYLGQGTAVTPAMAKAMNRWQRSFYNLNTPKGGHPTGLAAALTGYLSTMVTSELAVRISGSARADYLQRTMDRFMPALQRAVQLAAAEGQCVLRPRIEDGEILVELIPGSRFYPIRFDPSGRPSAGYFADFRTSGSEELVRLESFDYRAGTLILENHAYRLKGDKLDREIPLDSLACWSGLEKETVVEKAPGPLFGLIRMPFAGTVDPASELPVSLYAGAEESIREFDRLYGELLYELHSGKRKRILERQALPGLSGKPVPGALGYQDLTADTYLVLDPMEQQKPFDDYSPVMRTEEYLSALRSLLHLIENQCHLSAGALALEVGSGGPVTATEIVSRDRTTYHTCAAVQEQGLRPALLDLIAAMDALCDLYGLCPAGRFETAITFGDSVFEDTGTEFDRLLRMAQAQILRPEKLLSWYFHVDEDTARRDYLKKEETDGHRDP